MPQGMTLATTTKAVIAAIVADVTTAWNPASQIHLDPPEMQKDGQGQPQPALPVAYVLLTGTEPNEEESTLTTEAFDLSFELVLRAKKPGRGEGSVSERKRALVEALRVRLTKGANYHGLNREWGGETYLDDDVRGQEANAIWCQVGCRFVVTVETAAR